MILKREDIEALSRQVEQALAKGHPPGTGFFASFGMFRELLRLAKLGLWAQAHGIKAAKDCKALAFTKRSAWEAVDALPEFGWGSDQ
jgi:hypothetical protein